MTGVIMVRSLLLGIFSSMTAAGVSTLLACYEQSFTGTLARGMTPEQSRPVQRGLDYLDRNFADILRAVRGGRR